MFDRLQDVWMAAQDGVKTKHRQVLQDIYGVSRVGCVHSSAAQFGVLSIIADDADGLWEPAPNNGFQAVIMPTNISHGEKIEDLIAFRPAEPRKFWLCRDEAQWMGYWELGTRFAFRPTYYANPTFTQHYERTTDTLNLFETPLDFFRHRCDGAVPLCDEAYRELIYVQADITVGSSHQRKKAYRPFIGVVDPKDMPKITVRAEADV